MAAYPRPFLQSLCSPLSLAELHVPITFHNVIFCGLLLVALVPGKEYTIGNPWRLTWIFFGKLMIKAVPLAVRLAYPGTPWPLAISRNIHREGVATLFYALALPMPAAFQAVIAIGDLLQVIAICGTFGEGWTADMSPCAVVMCQAAAAMAAVCVTACMYDPGCRRSVRRVKDPSANCKAGYEGGDAGAGQVGHRCAKKAPSGNVALTTPERLVDKYVGCSGTNAQPKSPAASATEARAPLLKPAHRGQEPAVAASSAGVTTPIAGARNLNHRAPITQSAGFATALALQKPLPYQGSASFTSVSFKLPDVEPWELLPGYETRVAAAVSAHTAGAASVVHMAVRSGCVELHLDLLSRGGCGPSSSGNAAVCRRSTDSNSGGRDSGAGGGLGHSLSDPHGLAGGILDALCLPAEYESTVRAQMGQQLLMLTPAARDADVDPATVPGGQGWALLSSRQLQTLEMPWISQVEPPAVVMPASAAPPSRERATARKGALAAAALQESVSAAAYAATASGESIATSAGGPGCAEAGRAATALLTMVVCGAREWLQRAHTDADMELVAQADGSFLRVADLRWLQPPDAPVAASSRQCSSASAHHMRTPGTATWGHRGVEARVELPLGHSGTIRLALMRRGVASQAYSLLVLHPQDAGLALEVAALRRRVPKEAGPAGCLAGSSSGELPLGNVDRFVGDLGRWLRYRDVCRAQAALAADPGGATAGGRRGGGDDRGFREMLRSRLRGGAAWCAAAHAAVAVRLAHSARVPVAKGGGGYGPAHGDVRAYLGFQAASQRKGGKVATAFAPEAASPLSTASGTSASAPGAACLQLRSLPAMQALTPALHSQMAATRRVVLEFALEQGCSAVAAALLEHVPVPSQHVQPSPLFAHAAGARTFHVSASSSDQAPERSYRKRQAHRRREVPRALTSGAPAGAGLPDEATAAAASAGWRSVLEAADASLAASADGLTLLHRAVRSGQGATVEVVLSAARSLAAAAQAATPASTLDQADAAASPSAPALSLRSMGTWDTPDAYGITPLHYAAVLADGGRLARALLAAYPATRRLWRLERPGMPSPAAFAADAGADADLQLIERDVPAAAQTAAAADAPSTGESASKGLYRTLSSVLLGNPCGLKTELLKPFAPVLVSCLLLVLWHALAH